MLATRHFASFNAACCFGSLTKSSRAMSRAVMLPTERSTRSIMAVNRCWAMFYAKVALSGDFALPRKGGNKAEKLSADIVIPPICLT